MGDQAVISEFFEGPERDACEKFPQAGRDIFDVEDRAAYADVMANLYGESGILCFILIGVSTYWLIMNKLFRFEFNNEEECVATENNNIKRHPFC